MSETNICPKCGSQLKHVRMLNEEIFGTEDNPYVGYVCLNKDCKGWFCQACDEWHPYGTCCAVAMVKNVRGHDYQDRYQEEC